MQLLSVLVHEQQEKILSLSVGPKVLTWRKQPRNKVLPLVGQRRQQVQLKQSLLVRMPLLRVLNQPLSVTIPVQQGIHPLLSAATIGISYELNQLRQQEINRSIKSSKS